MSSSERGPGLASFLRNFVHPSTSSSSAKLLVSKPITAQVSHQDDKVCWRDSHDSVMLPDFTTPKKKSRVIPARWKELRACDLRVSLQFRQELGDGGGSVGELDAIELADLVERPREEFFATPAVGLQVALMVDGIQSFLIVIHVEVVVHNVGAVVFVHSGGFGAGIVETFGEEIYSAAQAGQVGKRWFRCGCGCWVCRHSLVLLSGLSG